MNAKKLSSIITEIKPKRVVMYNSGRGSVDELVSVLTGLGVKYEICHVDDCSFLGKDALPLVVHCPCCIDELDMKTFALIKYFTKGKALLAMSARLSDLTESTRRYPAGELIHRYMERGIELDDIVQY